jgi:SOS-response transcriptional repressor LexA
MGVFKTPQAVSKWLNGESIAEADSMVALSAWLKVRREWLEYGIEPKAANVPLKPVATISKDGNASSITPVASDRIPLISWRDVRSFCRSPEDTEVSSWIACPIEIGKAAFALTVENDSMTNPGVGATYPLGCIIFVNPEAIVSAGDKVIASVPDSDQLTFKIFTEDAGRNFLRPINPQYPVIDITGNVFIFGKIVGTFISE